MKQNKQKKAKQEKAKQEGVEFAKKMYEKYPETLKKLAKE